MKNGLKILLVITSIAVAFALAIFVITSNHQTTGGQNTDNVLNEQDIFSEDDLAASLITPRIIAEQEITLELLETAKLDYEIQNIQNYDIIKTISNQNILTIDNQDIIHPQQIGSTIITISINCSPMVEKQIVVNIIDCVKNVEFLITDMADVPASNYYANTDYKLHIIQNMAPTSEPEIICSMQDFALISKNDNIMIFRFNQNTAGQFGFTYNGKYINKSQSYTALARPENISVSFTNIQPIDNKIYLYLIDNSFITQANTDGFYSATTFSINKLNEQDTIACSVAGSSISLSQNTISAKSSGVSVLTFSQKITSQITISKQIQVYVSEIDLQKVVINGTETSPFESIENTIYLKSGKYYDFSFSKLPIYASKELSIDYNENLVNFENNKLKLKSENNSTIYLIYDNNIVYTLNLVYEQETTETITYSISLNENNKQYCDVTIDDNNKRIEVEMTDLPNIGYFVLKISKYIDSELSLTQDFSAEFSSLEVCYFSGKQTIYDGNLSISVLSSGTCTITITDNDTNESFEIEVSVI